jgi:ABC-type spermidine/putrescine transport system permease subunit I
MEKILLNSIFFFVLALIIFLADYLFVFKRKLKSKKVKNEEIMEFNYLIYKFKLDKNKVLYKPMALYCALINGFIISGVVTVICLFDIGYIWRLLIGFVMLLGLIYSIYEIYGRILIKKGWQKKDE